MLIARKGGTSEAFEAAKVPLVLQTQLGSGGQGNAFGTLLALMNSLKACERTADRRGTQA